MSEPQCQQARAHSVSATAILPDLALILDDNQWQSYQQLQADPGFAPHCQALSWAGLFTDYLAKLDRGPVGIDLIQQQPVAEQPDINRRDVRILTGTSLAAVASTLIAEQVLDAEPWLRTLGGKPIGETLEARLGAVRTDVRYRAFPADAPLFANFSHEKTLWGRRYRYRFSSGELSITEVIADSVVAAIYQHCPQQV